MVSHSGGRLLAPTVRSSERASGGAPCRLQPVIEEWSPRHGQEEHHGDCNLRPQTTKVRDSCAACLPARTQARMTGTGNDRPTDRPTDHRRRTTNSDREARDRPPLIWHPNNAKTNRLPCRRCSGSSCPVGGLAAPRGVARALRGHSTAPAVRFAGLPHH